MTEPLYIVRCRIDSSRLYAFARKSRAATAQRFGDFDEGYAVHALFAALFNHGAAAVERVAPKPFRVSRSSGRSLGVLGYAPVEHQELRRRAAASADPVCAGVCDVEAMDSKPVPTSFERGARLEFSVRICPVLRVARRGPMTRERAEVDAYIANRWAADDAATPAAREQVYLDWLRDDLAKEGAATLVHGTMTGFQLRHLYRRTQGEKRAPHATARPDVTFDGTLEVGDAEAFRKRLARGVGRHRAFGFGMLLLRRVQGRR